MPVNRESSVDHCGRVVILNGTASSGKSSLARAVQALADGMWLVVGQDDFAHNLVPRWVKVDDAHDAERGDDGFRFVREEAGALHVETGEVGARLLRGYRHAVAAFARAGNDVIVDECKFDPNGWAEWQQALGDIPSTWVRVECDLAVCEQREAAREDRRLLVGLARGQYDRVHADAVYDLVVDLTDGDVERCARAVLTAVE